MFYVVVMEKASYSLEHVLCHYPFFNQSAVKKLTMQLIEGLCRIHSLRFLHQNINPWNILIVDKNFEKRVFFVGFGGTLVSSLNPVFFSQRRLQNEELYYKDDWESLVYTVIMTLVN